ncbi:MAG: hypothetical protein ACI9JN_001128, partial [Bacteroidia bacterium]
NDSAHYYSANGKIIASIWNLSTYDFGATTVQIDETGTTAQNFDTNTVAGNKIFSKTLKITPTSNNTSKSVKIATYYTNAELAGWKTATGEFAKDVQMFKTTGAIASSTVAQGTVPTSPTTDSAFNGSDLCIIGTFSNGFSGIGGGGGAGGGGGPLPVTLLDFQGNRQSDQVELTWSTASEINNERFDIQRSVDGFPFETIGTMMGAGNSNNVLNYRFEDITEIVQESNTLCYKLKQIDYDGAYELSKTVCLESKHSRPDIVVGPNPFSNYVEVNINPWVSNAYSVEVVNLNGAVVYVQSDMRDGRNVLDLKHLKSGIYFIAVIRDGERVSVKKFIKQL